MKWLILPVILVTGISLYHFLSTPILMESAESKTVDGGPVFNEITWSLRNGKEVWEMKQTHGGKDLPRQKWDRLAIIINGKASFLQLDENGERVEYRASCFMCHPNGPRAIRPVEGTLSLGDTMKVKLLNLRIKLYGKVETRTLPQIGKTPFRHSGKVSNTPLTLPRCTSCHTEDGFFSRGTLTRQNAITIDYMVKNAHMPPIGDLTSEERDYLQRFLDGL